MARGRGRPAGRGGRGRGQGARRGQVTQQIILPVHDEVVEDVQSHNNVQPSHVQNELVIQQVLPIPPLNPQEQTLPQHNSGGQLAVQQETQAVPQVSQVVQPPPIDNVAPVNATLEAMRAGVLPNLVGPPYMLNANEQNRFLDLSIQLVDLDVKEFKGTEGVIFVDKWLADMRRHFRIMGCTENEKVQLAANHLVGNAYDWWESCVHKYGQDYIDTMTWADFQTMFKEEYIPPFERFKMKRQFQELTQGQLTVGEYYLKFSNLSRYVPTVEEEDKIDKFITGLIPPLQYRVGGMHFNTVREAVSSASMHESMYNRLKKENVKSSRKRDDSNRSGNRPGNQNRDVRNQFADNRNQSQNDWDDNIHTQADKRQRFNR